MAPRRSFLGLEPARRRERADATALPALAAEPTIALVQINQQALFFTQMNEGAEKKAKELGAKLVIFNANNDPAAQNNAIETYIADKVDGMVVVAIDTNGIVPAVQAAAAAGIPVAAVDAILPPGPQIAQVGVDNEAAGRAIGEHFLKVTGGRPSSASSVRSTRPSRTCARRASRTSSRRPRVSPWPASSTGGTSRTTRCRRPRA